jgi:glycosyltransferase involved in cell wall biosynthesis
MDANDQKRVAIFVPSLRGGGAERVMVTLANGFTERGLAVDLVLAKAEGPYLDEVCADVRIVDLDASRVLFSLPKLIGYLRRERPVAMLSALSHANIVAIVARSIARVPMRLVVSERSLPSFKVEGKKYRVVDSLMRILYPMADAIICISSKVASEIINDYNIDKKIVHIVRNPVDADKIRRLSMEKVEHSWLKEKKDPIIISVGRLVAEKDYRTLLKSFRFLRERKKAKLVILGDGPLKKELIDLADELGLRNDVEFLGYQKNPFAYMSRAAAFVLASTHEGFGNVLVEAMVCGVPVISTADSGGPAEIIENGRWGRLVISGNPYALAQAISDVIEEEVKIDTSERVKYFSIDYVVSEYLLILSGANKYGNHR